MLRTGLRPSLWLESRECGVHRSLNSTLRHSKAEFRRFILKGKNPIFWCSASRQYLSYTVVVGLARCINVVQIVGWDMADHSKKAFSELQSKRSHRYVIFKIDEKKKELLVEKTGNPTESFDDFQASLPEDDCRYAVYDYDFVTIENCQKSKIFFISWSPAASCVRAKMIYAASKERIKRALNGIHYEIQATDPTEMDLEVLQHRAQ